MRPVLNLSVAKEGKMGKNKTGASITYIYQNKEFSLRLTLTMISYMFVDMNFG